MIDYINLDEAVLSLQDGLEIRVDVGDSSFVVGDMHNYVGAPNDEEGYISEYLGNVWYSDAKHILKETVHGMANGDKELINDAKFSID